MTTKRYVVVEIPQDPNHYHFELDPTNTNKESRALRLRDNMQEEFPDKRFEIYDRNDNQYLGSSDQPYCVTVRPYYTIHHVQPDIINDQLGHDFQVIEARYYHSQYMIGRMVMIILDQFGIPYPESRSEVWSRGVELPIDPGSPWHTESGATIHNDSLCYHLNAIREAVIKEWRDSNDTNN